MRKKAEGHYSPYPHVAEGQKQLDKGIPYEPIVKKTVRIDVKALVG